MKILIEFKTAFSLDMSKNVRKHHSFIGIRIMGVG